MARKHNHRLISILPLIILLYLSASSSIQAQSPPNVNDDNPDYIASAKFTPSMAVIIAVIIASFFIIGFFSIYIRRCGGNGMNSAAASAAARSRRQRGLEPAILETFPTLVYSEVKQHKVGKGALECAICLNEFDDEDTIRLLPKCDHAFHRECIDAWLATHVTCPVCRADYSAASSVDAAAEGVPPRAGGDEGERKEEMKELARMASKVRRNGSRRGGSLPRWHSTGHSLLQQEGGFDRYRLRLPDDIRKDVIASGMLRREASASTVIGEESGRRGRSGRMGRSDRWSTLLVRSVSAKIPAFGNWKRGEEGSLRGKFAGGGFFKKSTDDDDDPESSTAALNRV